jgi:hypothetical protein
MRRAELLLTPPPPSPNGLPFYNRGEPLGGGGGAPSFGRGYGPVGAPGLEPRTALRRTAAAAWSAVVWPGVQGPDGRGPRRRSLDCGGGARRAAGGNFWRRLGAKGGGFEAGAAAGKERGPEGAGWRLRARVQGVHAEGLVGFPWWGRCQKIGHGLTGQKPAVAPSRATRASCLFKLHTCAGAGAGPGGPASAPRPGPRADGRCAAGGRGVARARAGLGLHGTPKKAQSRCGPRSRKQSGHLRPRGQWRAQEEWENLGPPPRPAGRGRARGGRACDRGREAAGWLPSGHAQARASGGGAGRPRPPKVGQYLRAPDLKG